MIPRVILSHRSGLRQILGTLDQLKTHLSTEELPVEVSNAAGETFALINIQPNYVLYRAIIRPATPIKE